MKTIRSIFMLSAAATLLGGLTACNNETTEPQVSENVVQLTASISSPFTTRSTPLADDATQFTEGDEIYVQVTGGEDPNLYTAASTYRLGNSQWSPSDGNYLLWKFDQLNFEAYYPASVAREVLTTEGNLGNFISHVPTDQSTKEKIAKADLMMMEPPRPFDKTETVDITMQHKTIKLTVHIKGFMNQYEPGVKVENVRFITSSVNPAVVETKEYLPYTESDGSVNSSYTILLPTIWAGSLANLQIQMQPKGHNAISADLTSLYGGWNYDTHYTVNLTVGKDRLEMNEITVSDWSATTDIEGGNAEE